MAQDLLKLVDEAARLLIRPPQDQAADMGRERKPDQEMAFAAARFSAIPDLIGFGEISQGLRTGIGRPDRGAQLLRYERVQSFLLVRCQPRHTGEDIIEGEAAYHRGNSSGSV